MSDRRSIPALMRGLTDSNRLVRLRAAEALVGLNGEMLPIFQQVIAAGDRYGLHAYLTAVENANVHAKLEEELQGCALPAAEKARLRNALHSGSLTAEELSPIADVTTVVASS
jgi:HEAT repeat protein